MLLANAQVKKF